jgi:hypothetical protein
MQDIVKLSDAGASDGFALGRFIFSDQDFKGDADFCQVGEAEITITFLPEKEITTKQVQSLQEQLRKHRVESQEVENHIRNQISKLLAITDGTVIDQ